MCILQMHCMVIEQAAPCATSQSGLSQIFHSIKFHVRLAYIYNLSSQASPPYEKNREGVWSKASITHVARAQYGAHQPRSSKWSYDIIIIPSMLITTKYVISQRATMDVESALTVATARLWYVEMKKKQN